MTNLSATHLESLLAGEVEAEESGPEHDRVEHADEAEEHGAVHVVLVAHPPPQQHDVHGVAEGAKDGPVNVMHSGR